MDTTFRSTLSKIVSH